MYDKLCLFCKYFYFDTGFPSLSVHTPDQAAEIGCNKGHWYVEMCKDTTETFRRLLMRALICKDFELVEMDWLDKPVKFKKG